MFALIALIAINYKYWGTGLLTILMMSAPYALIFFIANENNYKGRLTSLLRSSAAVIILLLALGLLFGIEPDPQSGIGVMFAIAFQYGALFISEALIALFTYREEQI